MTKLSFFDRLWQAFPHSPSAVEVYELLAAQLNSPAVAVPIAHPFRPGAKAYAQLLLIPACCLSTGNRNSLEEALTLLADRGRIESMPSTSPYTIFNPNASFLAQLVLRSDDPAISSGCADEGRSASADGAP